MVTQETASGLHLKSYNMKGEIANGTQRNA
jgi:hypothetical protein